MEPSAFDRSWSHSTAVHPRPQSCDIVSTALTTHLAKPRCRDRATERAPDMTAWNGASYEAPITPPGFSPARMLLIASSSWVIDASSPVESSRPRGAHSRLPRGSPGPSRR